MRNTRRWSIIRCILVAVCATCAATPAAQAQAYPVRPIRLILPFAGGSDTVGRLIATKLSAALGQQVVPEPRLGAAGNIGFLAAAKSPPDGYTLLIGAVPVLTNPHLNPKVGYDGIRDFAPVALLATIPNAVIVHPSVPARSMRELIRLARAKPGRITYGSGGVGSANQLAAKLIEFATGAKFTDVPYKSASFGIIGALSGEVDMVITVVSSAAPYVHAGKMRGLAVLDTKRNSSLPDVPDSAEVGLPGVIAVNWYAILAPAGTPQGIIERLNREAVKAMAEPDMQQRFARIGGTIRTGTPEQAEAFLRTENARWAKVIREAHIKLR